MTHLDFRVLLPWLAVLVFASVMPAQQQSFDFGTFDYPLPDATVGVPYSTNFGEGLDEALQSTTDAGAGFSFSYGFSQAGGTMPPGMSLKSSGLFWGTPTAAGNYTTPIKFTMAFSIDDPTAPFSFTYTYTMNAILTVAPGSGPQLSLEPRGLTFVAVQGAKTPQVQSLSFSNRGGQPVTYTTAAAAPSGDWLSVSAGGTAPAFGSASIAVTANPAGLGPGFYSGKVTVTAGASGGPSFDVAVALVVSGSQQGIVLSQSGLTFRGVAGGGSVPSQSFTVLAGGASDLSWTATASTLSGGSGWLSMSPSNGRSTVTAASTVDVKVNPAGLAAGQYYGAIQVAAQGVSNSPQSVSVVFDVLPAETKLDPVIRPSGLVFVARAGGSNPAPQAVTITNVSRTPYTVSAATFTDNGGKWLTATPASGSAAADQPLRLSVQPGLTGLSAGVYLGEVDLRFKELNSIHPVIVLLVVLPGTGPSASKEGNFADGCTPKALYPVPTQLGSGFTTTAAWPTVLEVLVVDDCGQPLTSGAVTAAFSNGDPPLVLTSLLDGRWTGTWQPRNQSAKQVTITVRAQQSSPKLDGTTQMGGAVEANTSAPVVGAGGVVSAASFQGPLAPGSFAAVYGLRLADGSHISDPPYPKELADTQVFLGGKQVPLFSASDGQINMIVPYDVPVNSTQQLLVRKGSTFSVPEPVTIATAQPAVFTWNNSGSGPGIIVGYQSDGTPFLVTTDNPASAKTVIVIYCAGLGPVNQPVVAGDRAPLSPLAWTSNSATVTIGGKDAPVAFAGLTPTAAGLYQVNTAVPDGLTPGTSVPVVITVAGQSSRSDVTIAIK